MRFNRFRLVMVIILVILNISCDQISKKVARTNIENNERIQVVEGHVILTKVENDGAAIGLGSDLPPSIKIIVLQILPMLVLIYLLRLIIVSMTISKASVLAFTFIIGGGIGNIIDRVLYGSVTDFLYLEYGFFRTGIFNMADVSVMLGTFIILYELIIRSPYSRSKRA